ncbi:hypothetical protein GR294_22770 [Raoultella sp. Lac2]|nr:hypothetical protein [Raoultella sp. Lac2]MXF98825.1 hypothetical protein [Raoultella sp. Lac1]
MGRRRNHDRRDLPPNLYVRNDGYYSYRDPRNDKEDSGSVIYVL